MSKRSLILASSMLFFFLFLTPVSPQCRTITDYECYSYVNIPGMEFTRWGIDITTLRINPFGYPLMNRHIRSGDDNCTVCENPLLEGKPLQVLPQAITNWKANISCQQKVQHYVTESAILMAKKMTELNIKNNWKEELDVEVNSSANGQWILAGSDSYLTSFIKERSSRDKYIFHLHHVSCSYYKFSINKDQSVSEDFKYNVQKLPEKYDSNSKLNYRHLIELYGTHFRSEFDLGVRVMILTTLPVCRMSLEGITVSEINHCLETDVGQIIDIDNVTMNSELQKCMKKTGSSTGLLLYRELQRFIEGGDYYSVNYINRILAVSKAWLESVKSQPGLLSYSLEPLHTLLDKGDPRREGLQRAVSGYVKEKALLMSCSRSCPPGAQLSASDPCSCQCPSDNITTSMCCPKRRGLAKLTVTIQRAEGLWGDYITRTDAYVNVFYNDSSNRKVLCTSTVWNNNNPVWNEKLDFGIIQFGKPSRDLEIHVWDEDFGWDDDLLGECVQTLKVGDSSYQVCTMTNGRLHYKYHLACVPHLAGHNCSDYIPLRSN